VTDEQQREAQRLALLHLLRQAIAGPGDWGSDLPTLAGRLMNSGAVTVDVVRVFRELV
jgi:hypothetical protein